MPLYGSVWVGSPIDLGSPMTLGKYHGCVIACQSKFIVEIGYSFAKGASLYQTIQFAIQTNSLFT